VTVFFDGFQGVPTYLLRGIFGNYLLLGDFREDYLKHIQDRGGVKLIVPLRNTEAIHRWCERLFTVFGARVILDVEAEINAPVVTPEDLTPQSEVFAVKDPEKGIFSQGDSCSIASFELRVKEDFFEYPCTGFSENRISLPATWKGDSESLSQFLDQQWRFYEAYGNLLEHFRKEGFLFHPCARNLSVAFYDDFEYDRIDFDTLSPETRRTLSRSLLDCGATQKRGVEFDYGGVPIRLLKAPRTLSSPVCEGMSYAKDALYLLTPTQMAASLIDDPMAKPAELYELASLLPFNLPKLRAASELSSRWQAVGLQKLKSVLAESGRFYHRRRQKGIRGRYPPSANHLRKELYPLDSDSSPSESGFSPDA